MEPKRRLELRVGLFLNLALALVIVVIWLLGSTQNLFSRSDFYYVTLPDAEGLVPGAKITVAGVGAGTVESFALDEQNRNVRVRVKVASRFENAIRRDSYAEVTTQGVLGDKVIAIAAGSPSSPKLPPGQEIRSRETSSLKGVLGKSDQLVKNLNELVLHMNDVLDTIDDQLDGIHLKHSIDELDEILGKINTGNGTLGGLVNDPKLYDDLKALIGESNENRIVRNIVRKTIEDSEKKHPAQG